MKRNATYIMSRLVDPDHLAKPAQVGVDLTVANITTLYGGASIQKDQTIHGNKMDATLSLFAAEATGARWELRPGAYEVTFDQGLQPLAADEVAFILQRSSLNRNGSYLSSSVIDPGYGCYHLGATLYVAVPISIEVHARVAQIMIENCEAAEETYHGQYRNE
jgi:deoxycytidine triphosphate deaminase